ncbi:ras-like GTP-binding protein rhoA [Halichondria panicea]|uniref:ras-like GTP-binding protein rhoA n=1 Tax=Halichondria panicea TaxID=6063 RepID=UPI00312B8D16
MDRRIVLIGDAGCGKTALAMKMSENIFNDFYQPTSFENFQAELPTNKGRCQITIMDTSGCHENTQLRKLAYKECDAVIVCFDLTDEETLTSVEKKWIPELREYCPQVPVFIAGCKRAIMCENNCCCGRNCCMQTEEELLRIVSSTGAMAFLECSAAEPISEDGVENLFKFVVESSGKKKKSILTSIKKRSKQLKRRLSIHF